MNLGSRSAVLWLFFFIACCGLGYPTLSRYDPRRSGQQGLADAIYDQAAGTPRQKSAVLSSEALPRPLVTAPARLFYRLGRGRIPMTWEPVFFGLLVSGSLFLATTALILAAMGRATTGSEPVAALGAALFLLNFAIPNFHLSGLADAGEVFVLTALSWCLMTGHRRWLPLLGVAGALAKEGTVLFGVVFALAWTLDGPRLTASVRRWLPWIGAMCGVGIATFFVSGCLWTGYSPLGLLRLYNEVNPSEGDLPVGLLACLSVPSLVYLMGAPVGFGIWRIGLLPRPWTRACAAAAASALLAGSWMNYPEGAAKALFNICGPLLSLSAALLLTGHKPLPARRDS